MRAHPPSSRTDSFRTVRWYRVSARLGGVGLAYYATAYFSLKLSLVGASVTPLWPPTGIAVVALLVFGPSVWPAIAVAAFAVNAPISGPAWASVMITVGNTVTPLVAVRLLEAAGFRRTIATLRDALSMVAAALASTLLSASVGSAALLLSGGIQARAFLPTWSVWWTGDAMGILIVAPFLLTALASRRVRLSWPRVGEVVGEFALLAAACALMFVTARPVWVIVFPLLALIAWRLYLPGAAPAALLVSTSAIAAAVSNSGPFAGSDLLGRMLGLQTFNAAVAFISLFLATVVAERSRVRDALERAAIDLGEVVERRTAIVETFQRSMLPETLPDIADVELAARYLPASTEVDVGGDWYDAVALDGGRLAVAIGDVAGHGTQAAATMAQLRMAARAYALDGRSPAAALRQLNVVAHGLGSHAMATLLYAVIDPASGDYVFASAGHLPPLVVSASRRCSFVDGGVSAPLGAAPYIAYTEAAGTLEVGSTLLLYTDGLVERRGEHIDEGLRALGEAAVSAPADLESACDHVIRRMAVPGDDDVALVAIRRSVIDGTRLQLRRAADPESVSEIRRILRRWLGEHEATSEDREDVLLASSEACTNVVQHAYGSEGGPVFVDASVSDRELLITVRDEGTWRARRPSGTGGRGVGLMRSVMDEVDVIGSQAGTEVRMRRRLRGGSDA